MRSAAIPFAALAVAWAMPAGAGEPQVEGAVYLERGSGAERLVEPATRLSSGDKVVLLVRWRAAADRDGFTVTAPVPSTLAYSRDSSEAVEVSIDGGKSWGRLGSAALRGARPDQVTHLRWRIGAQQAAEGSGSFAYSARVR